MRISPRQFIDRKKRSGSTRRRVTERGSSRPNVQRKAVFSLEGSSPLNAGGVCREILAEIRGEMESLGGGTTRESAAATLSAAAQDLWAMETGQRELLQTLREYLVQQRTQKAFSGSVLVG